MSDRKKSSFNWSKEKSFMSSYTRITRGGSSSHHSYGSSDFEDEFGMHFGLRSKSSRSVSQSQTSTKFYFEEDELIAEMDLPPDFVILPIYEEIMEDPLPPMEVFPPFKVQGEEIEDVILKMDMRIRKNPSYRAFLDETKNLLIYVLQEVKLRRTLQNMLLTRESEMKAYQEYQRRDPRVCKVIALADHWRKSNETSEEKAQQLLQEIQNLTAETKLLETKLASMQKRQEKLEMQIHKHKTCEQEKDQLEEKIMVKEKTTMQLAEQMEQLEETVKTMTNDAAQKEAEFKLKLESAPDRNAFKITNLTRELEIMTMDKEYKQQEIKELQAQVNALMAENSRTSDRVSLLMSSVKSLKTQWKNLELRHRIVVSKNKGLIRQVEASLKASKISSIDLSTFHTENSILRKKVASLTKELREEKSRNGTILRHVSRLEEQLQAVKTDLEAKKYENSKLEKNIEVSTRKAAKCGSELANTAVLNHLQTQKVLDLQKKFNLSIRHLKFAHTNLVVLNDEVDRAEEALRCLKSELIRCQQQNVRNHSTITHLYQMLDCSENMVRLQIKENDALVISKNRLVDILRNCGNQKSSLQNEVSRLQTVKTALEDVASTHKFMLEFVESERDGALRNHKLTEDVIVILQRRQVAKIAQLTRSNGLNSKLLLQLEELQNQLIMQKREVTNLSKALKHAEGILMQSDYSYQSILSQRDMFGARILQQNNEMKVTQIKMAEMTQALDKGETCYRDRCNDIIVLKKEIQILRKKVKSLEHLESLNRELRTEISFLTKGMTIEMTKRHALERCKMPKVHRYREIQSKNLSVYEMILKIQALQKTLIRKTQECIEKEKEISIRNDSIEILQNSVRRRDEKQDKKVEERVVRSIVDKKNQTIKALTAELNMLRFYFTDERKLPEEERRELATAKISLRRSKSASLSCASSQNSAHSSKSCNAEGPANKVSTVFKPRRSLASDAKCNVAGSTSNHS